VNNSETKEVSVSICFGEEKSSIEIDKKQQWSNF